MARGAFWLSVGLACILHDAAAHAQPFGAGDMVVVTTDTRLMTAKAGADDRVWPGMVLWVDKIDGTRLSVSGEKKGWLDQRFVVPLDKKAADVLTSLINKSPNSASLYLGRANVYVFLFKLKDAIADCDAAIRLSPTDSDAYRRRGDAWQLKAEDDMIRASDKEEIEGDHKAAAAIPWRSEFERSIADYNEAIRLDPEDERAFQGRGKSWHRLGNYAKADVDYTEALRHNPKLIRLYYDRAMSRWHGGQSDLALADLGESIRLDPTFGDAFFYRANFLQEKEEYDKAIADYDEYLRLRPNAFEGFEGRGNVWQKKGDFDRAIADYDEALRIVPASTDAALKHAYARYCKGEHQQAVDDLTVVYRKHTNDTALARCIFGLRDLAAGRNESAQKHFEWARDHAEESDFSFEIAAAELKRLGQPSGEKK